MFNQSRVGRLMFNESIGYVYAEGAAAAATASGSLTSTRVISGGASVTGTAQGNVTANYIVYGAGQTIMSLGTLSVVAIALNYGDVLLQTTATVNYGTPFRISYVTVSINGSATTQFAGAFVGEIIAAMNTSASATALPNRIASEPNTICNGFTLTDYGGNRKASLIADVSAALLLDFIGHRITSGNADEIAAAMFAVTVLVIGWENVIFPQPADWVGDPATVTGWIDTTISQTDWKKVN